VEIDKMNKIPMAVAVALVLSAPLAYAASDNLPSPAAIHPIHCPNFETPSPINGNAMSYSEAKKQAAEEEVMSLCRWDFHKKGGINPANGQHQTRVSDASTLFLVRR
jgi:hypothetical protein